MPLSSVVGAQSIVKPGVCTSSTRPASPFDGQVIYETDTNRALVWDGSAWDILSDMGAWTTYTPVIKGGATTVSATISYAKYIQVGKTVIVQVRAVVTSAGATNGIIDVTLPTGLAVLTPSNQRIIGSFMIEDVGVGFYSGVAVSNTGTSVKGFGTNTGDFMGGQLPAMTLANGDFISMSVMYEAA